MKTKVELRKEMLQRRKSIGADELLKASESLMLQAFELIQKVNPKTVHVFLSSDKHAEPNTWLLIQLLRKNMPQVRICAPVSTWADASMESYLLTAETKIGTDPMGLPEPVNSILVPSSDIDFIVLPLLAFNEQKHRLGYGKGFYDRYLNRCRPDCYKLGISLFSVSEFEEEAGDVACTEVITPIPPLQTQTPTQD